MYKAKCYSKNEGKDLNTRIDTANSGAPYWWNSWTNIDLHFGVPFVLTLCLAKCYSKIEICMLSSTKFSAVMSRANIFYEWIKKIEILVYPYQNYTKRNG